MTVFICNSVIYNFHSIIILRNQIIAHIFATILLRKLQWKPEETSSVP